jgi:predicted phage-related endonuclease
MTIKYFKEMIQGDEEWYAARRGLLTASEMKLIITTTLKIADNDKSRAHVYELAAQRITGYTEPSYVGDDMLRGIEDEELALTLYNEKIAPVQRCGFVTNDEFGFVIGCSPDGLVGEDTVLEVKSRRQKFQVATIIDNEVPDDYLIQVQTILLVTRRPKLDFISYSGGLPMAPITVRPDTVVQEAIVKAATAFEVKLQEKLGAYRAAIETNKRLLPTERKIEQEMF